MAELKFSIGVDDSKVEQAVQRMRQQFETISKNAVTSGKSIDDVVKRMVTAFEDGIDEFSTMSEQLEFQKQVVKDLGSELDKLGESLKEVTPSGEWETVDKSLQEAKQALVEWNKALADSEQEAQAADKANESLRSQLRKMREELVAMEAAGKRGTEEYRKLQEEAGKLQDAISDATKQMSIMSHDQRGFQGIISGLSGVSGAMSAAMGVMGMFTDENEKMQKVMLKVQSLMSITVGLQQLQATLDKDSAFRLVTLNGLKEWWAKVTAQAAATQELENVAVARGGVAAKGAAGGFKLLGAAIKSIPGIGWLLTASAAIVGIIALISKRVKAEKQLNGEMTRQKALISGIAEAKDAAAKSTGEEVLKLQLAADKIRSMKSGTDEYKRAMNDISSAIGVQIDKLGYEKDKILELVDAWVAVKVAMAEGEEYLKMASDLQTKSNSILNWMNINGDDRTSENKEKLIKDLKDLNVLSEKEINQIADAWKKGKLDVYPLVQGVREAKKNFLNEYKKAVKAQTDAQLRLDSAKADEDEANRRRKSADQHKKEIEQVEKEIREYEKDLEDSRVKLQNEASQAEIDAMEEGVAKELTQLERNHQLKMDKYDAMEREFLEKAKEQAKRRAQVEGTQYDENSVVIDDTLQSLLDTLRKSEEEIYQNSIQSLIGKAEGLFEQSLSEYTDYLERYVQITKKYGKLIKEAIEKGLSDEVERLVGDMTNEINDLNKEFSKISKNTKEFVDALNGLNGNLSDDFLKRLMKEKEILEEMLNANPDNKSAIDKLRAVNELLERRNDYLLEQMDMYDRLNVSYENYAAQVSAYRDKIATTTDNDELLLSAANLEAALQQYSEELDAFVDEMNRQMIEIAEGATNAFGMVYEVAKEAGTLADDQQELLGDMTDAFGDIVQGFATGGPIGAVFAALSSILPKIVKWAERLKNAAKEELKAHVDDLKAQRDRLHQLSSFWSNAASSGYGGNYEGLGGGDAYSNYMSNLDSVISNLRDQIESLKKIGSEAADDLQDAYIQLAEAVQEKFDAMVNDAERLIGITSSQMQSEVFDLSNASADDITKYFQQLIFDSYRTALINTALATQTMSGTVEGFFSDLTLNIGNLMQRYIDAMFNGNQEAMDDVLRHLQYYLVDGYGTLSYTLTDIFGNIKDELESFSERLGLDYSALSEESTATSKGIAQASQESIDELNGRMTVIQAHTAQLLENSGLMRLDVASIRSIVGNIGDDTAAMRSMMSDMNTDLHYIRNNM